MPIYAGCRTEASAQRRHRSRALRHRRLRKQSTRCHPMIRSRRPGSCEDAACNQALLKATINFSAFLRFRVTCRSWQPAAKAPCSGAAHRMVAAAAAPALCNAEKVCRLPSWEPLSVTLPVIGSSGTGSRAATPQASFRRGNSSVFRHYPFFSMLFLPSVRSALHCTMPKSVVHCLQCWSVYCASAAVHLGGVGRRTTDLMICCTIGTHVQQLLRSQRLLIMRCEVRHGSGVVWCKERTPARCQLAAHG